MPDDRRPKGSAAKKRGGAQYREIRQQTRLAQRGQTAARKQ
jgi:hypothetical protein